MIQLKALLLKEFKEAFRDRRALMVAMSMAVMTPIMIFAMSKMLIKEMVATPAIYVKVAGVQYAPILIDALKKENILLFADVPTDEKEIWDDRNIVIDIPQSFAQDMLDGKTIDIILRTDYSDKAMNSPLRRIKAAVRSYSRTIGYKRLMIRGIDMRLLQPVKLIEQDTAVPNNSAKFITLILGMYLLMVAFMSGLSVAIDSSAGERERNVLEMLLCQPVSTLKIVIAKLLCASTIAFIAILLTLILTSISVGFVDLTKIGATFSLDAYTVMVLLILLTPLCLFASALQLFVSFQAKSFKEAQSTVTMIIMLPAMIPVVLMFIDDKPKWLDWLPVSGQSMLIEDIFKGLPVNWLAVVTTSVITLIITVALAKILAIRLKSEKVVLSLS